MLLHKCRDGAIWLRLFPRNVELTLLTCSDFGSPGGGGEVADEDVAPSDDPGGNAEPAPKAAAVVPLLSTTLAITAFRRIGSLPPYPYWNRTPRYAASNHVSCFSAVSEFEGTFSRPRSGWGRERTPLADPSLQTLARTPHKQEAFSGHIRLLPHSPRLHNDRVCSRGVWPPESDMPSQLGVKFQYLKQFVTNCNAHWALVEWKLLLNDHQFINSLSQTSA